MIGYPVPGTVAVRSGGVEATAPVSLSLAGGALHAHCCLPFGPIRAALEEAREYSWTLYGGDSLPIVDVPAAAIDPSGPWPADADVTLDLSLLLCDPSVSGPTSVIMRPGITVRVGTKEAEAK